jgi:plasmid stabilization system protein ParE
MKYKLIIQPPALADLEDAYRWIAERSPERAVAWFNGFIEALNSLKTLPERCEVAAESKYFSAKVRQLLYGKQGGVYRALYTIRGHEVHVLHIRHAARDFMSEDEFFERG